MDDRLSFEVRRYFIVAVVIAAVPLLIFAYFAAMHAAGQAGAKWSDQTTHSLDHMKRPR